MSYQLFLAEMRKSSTKNDDRQYRHYLRLVLGYLSSIEVIKIAAKNLIAFLPRFEHYYPNITWPREILEAVFRAARPDQHIIDAMYEVVWDKRFESPSSQQFITLVERISYAFENKDNLETVLNFAGRALTGSINIRKFERWTTDYPDDYRQYIEITIINKDNYSLEEQFQASLKYTHNSDVKLHETELMLSIADDIEEILSKKS